MALLQSAASWQGHFAVLPEQFTGISYLLVARNALYVPSMEHHLIPPFIMEEGGVKVKPTPKFQIDKWGRTIEGHALLFKKPGLIY